MSENITMCFSACKKQALMSMGWKKKNLVEYKCHWISICQREYDAHKELLPINTSHLSQVDLWLSALNPVTFKRGNKKGFHCTIKHTKKWQSFLQVCVTGRNKVAKNFTHLAADYFALNRRFLHILLNMSFYPVVRSWMFMHGTSTMISTSHTMWPVKRNWGKEYKWSLVKPEL